MIMDLFSLKGGERDKETESPLGCQSEQCLNFLFLPGFMWMTSITWKGRNSLCKSTIIYSAFLNKMSMFFPVRVQ